MITSVIVYLVVHMIISLTNFVHLSHTSFISFIKCNWHKIRRIFVNALILMTN